MTLATAAPLAFLVGTPALPPVGAALLLITPAFLLIVVECLRPGRVVPGAAGLLLLLLGLHRLSAFPVNRTGLALIAAGALLLVLSVVPLLRWAAGALGSAAFAAGLAVLGDGESLSLRPSYSVLGLALGLAIGCGTWLLLQVAVVARRAKRLPASPRELALEWQPHRPE